MPRSAIVTLVLVAIMGTGLAIGMIRDFQNPKGFTDFPIEHLKKIEYNVVAGAGLVIVPCYQVISSGWGEGGNEVHVFHFAGSDFSKLEDFVGGDYSKSVYPLSLRYFSKRNRYQIVDGFRIIVELKPPISQIRVEVSPPTVPMPKFQGNVL